MLGHVGIYSHFPIAEFLPILRFNKASCLSGIYSISKLRDCYFSIIPIFLKIIIGNNCNTVCEKYYYYYSNYQGRAGDPLKRPVPFFED